MRKGARHNPILLKDEKSPLIHRDLSWVQFNERVLHEAQVMGNPLLERVKFLAISASNLDEFFMIRLASLDRSIGKAARENEEKRANLDAARKTILSAVQKFVVTQRQALDLLSSELQRIGVRLVLEAQSDDPAFETGRDVFLQKIAPMLGPRELFKPITFVGLRSLQSAAVFSNGVGVRISRGLPQVFLKKTERGWLKVFFRDDLIRTHLGAYLDIQGVPTVYRLTRDGDFTVELESEATSQVPERIQSTLESRERGRAVRLQYLGDPNLIRIDPILKRLRISSEKLFPAPRTLGLHGLWTLVRDAPADILNKKGVIYPPKSAVIPAGYTRASEDIFKRISERDLLLHHPYESFDTYVNFIEAACADPSVRMIQQTVYRMDAQSAVIQAYKKAAKTKKIRIFIELRARFDELNNLKLAEELRSAGVDVRFGFGKLKLHAKVAQVTRDEEGGIRQYTHLSTGNYHAGNAKHYEDFGLLTAHPVIGEDVSVFFDEIGAGRVPSGFKALVTAPSALHRRLMALIDSEISAVRSGGSGRIFAKMNALVDEAIIQKLYEASSAGVKIDLVVRGPCSLVPGIKGVSEQIHVVSVVDRYLEHSRIYYFESSDALYLSSADWMPRNFFSRLEVAFPILDPEWSKEIRDVIIPVYLSDSFKAWELNHRGIWSKRTAAHPEIRKVLREYPILKGTSRRTQVFLEEYAQARQPSLMDRS